MRDAQGSLVVFGRASCCQCWFRHNSLLLMLCLAGLSAAKRCLRQTALLSDGGPRVPLQHARPFWRLRGKSSHARQLLQRGVPLACTHGKLTTVLLELRSVLFPYSVPKATSPWCRATTASRSSFTAAGLAHGAVAALRAPAARQNVETTKLNRYNIRVRINRH
jgi:hypothetical protein